MSMSYRELASLGIEPEDVPDDLVDPTEDFTCRFCGTKFNADADFFRHYDHYGCGCIPEKFIDIAEVNDIKPKDITSWSFENKVLKINGKVVRKFDSWDISWHHLQRYEGESWTKPQDENQRDSQE